MVVELFYGVTLSEKEPVARFIVSEQDKILAEQTLIIKQILLGPEAVDGEFNVVEAETENAEEEKIKIPIAVLKAGETRLLRPNIEFPSSSVTFKLIQGVGPVYIHGQHIVNDNEGDGEDFYEEEEDCEEIEDEVVHRIQNTNGKKAQKRKL